ncbi:hypothetical protein JVU11DRAFT_1055 [Chiua virens]|nr:hypothetical protein JVU11DRAFT_1055 [Chiua virens]
MPIVSITFYMVIIRITISKTASQGIVPPSSGAASGGRLAFSRMSRLSFGARDYPMKRMEVHITQLTETNERGDGESGSGSGEPKSRREMEDLEDSEMERKEDMVGQVLDGFGV